MNIKKLMMVVFSGAVSVVCAAELSAFHPTVDAALAQAHGLLVGKFLSADGLLLDYLGEIPTPKDCAEARPNAMGWWSPIENGPMFTGPYLAAICEKVRRGGSAADRETCRRMAAGLVKAASVSDVPGMIVRGFGSDGTCHYPLGSEDQTLPWFYGLHAYVKSPVPTEAERQTVVSKMCEVAEALRANGWGCPCDGRFKGENRGRFAGPKGLAFRGAAHYLFLLRAMFDVTGERVWLDRYEEACGQPEGESGLSRLEVCAKGYVTDLHKFSVEPNGLWIYVCAQGCLRELLRMDGNVRRRACFLSGLRINAERAAKFTQSAEKYDNSTEVPFKYANWRTGYRWRDQPTQKDADRVANTGIREILGTRKSFERKWMTTPLSACAVMAFSEAEGVRAQVERVIRHFDYATLNICEFFLAEVAWYALPAEEVVAR